jgi:NADH dehydrogenase
MDARHQVVIIGGGFGGLYAAQSLRRAPVRVTLLDRRNFHLFQPLLYQVATGALSPANIASPLRAVLKRQENTSVLLAEVTDIDLANRRVVFTDGEIPYDSVIVATGSRHHYFGKPQFEALAPGLKTIEDATEIRRRILLAFEFAERTTDLEACRACLTFVVVGAGATGVELAGAVGELAHRTLRSNFRHINPADARILLLEGTDRVLPSFPPQLSAKAATALTRLGVTVWTSALVTDVQPDAITVNVAGRSEIVRTRTVLWAAGVAASPLGKVLAKGAGVELDRAGRVIVLPDLSLPGHPEVFVIGDLAHCKCADGQLLPGVAQVAMQQGRYVARLIQGRLEGKPLLPVFRYHDRGSMATIGRASAVADLGWAHFNGWLAWLAWLFIHLIYLIQFENRLLVLGTWALNYFTRNRSARLVTGESPLPLRRTDSADRLAEPEAAAMAKPGRR